MSRWWIARFRPTFGRIVAVAVGVVFAVALVASYLHGAPGELPAVAAGSPVLLHLVRALAMAAIVGAVAVAILRLWRGDLPTELSATGAKWSPMAGPERVQEQLVHVERESKAAIERLTAYVESLAQRLPSQPGDERAFGAVEGALGQWEGALVDAERKDAISRAILALPERERLVIGLHYYDEATVREIAKVLEVSERTVEVLLSRGLQRLRDTLGEDPLAEH